MLAHLRRPIFKAIAIFAIVVPTLVGSTWAIVNSAIEQVLYQSAIAAGRNWASYLAQNVSDLADIAKGEKPSPSSMVFFERAQKTGSVFRYKIFGANGNLRLDSDKISAAVPSRHNLAEHNAAAAKSIAAGRPLVVVKEGKSPTQPSFFSEAYVPVIVGGKTVAVAETYVDQTEMRAHFHAAINVVASSLSILIGLAFGIPAVALVHRTKQKQRAEEHIRYLAYHDTLTGLPNRNQVIELLGQSFAAAVADGRMLAVHYIDLDNFKSINDTLGHAVGDQLIVAVAKRLGAIVGPHNVIARLAGDEFMVLQRDLSEPLEAMQMADQIIKAMARPYALQSHEVTTTTSVGIALAPTHSDDAAKLIKYADLAMYKSKTSGRNRASLFVPTMDAELRSRIELEKSIRDAANNDSFELLFQPLVDAPEGCLVGFEALLRLRTADGSVISPTVFIPIAEQMGLVSKIGAWVISEACRIASTWPEHLKIAVNLSPAQFAGDNIVDIVAAALSQSRLAPNRLELEITESLLLGHTETVLLELSRLRALGIAIVMDDFGTGYSSLGYLWRFPFDKIKIDRSFMLGLDSAEEHAKTVIETIVTLVRSLKMRVTVEGVENQRQLDFVRRVQCDQIQGFYYGRPMRASEIAALVITEFRDKQLAHFVPEQQSSQTRLSS